MAEPVGHGFRFSMTILGTLIALFFSAAKDYFLFLGTKKPADSYDQLRLLDVSGEIFLASVGLFIAIFLSPGLLRYIKERQYIPFTIGLALHLPVFIVIAICFLNRGAEPIPAWTSHWYWSVGLPDIISTFMLSYGAWVVAGIEEP